YFLEHGEFAQSLLDELFGKVDGPLSGRSDVYDSVFLRGLMQRVLRKFAREFPTDEFNERDSSIDDDLDYSRACFSGDCPIDLVTASENPNTTVEDVVDPRRSLAFEHLSVLYVAPWPVNIVLHETVLLKYNCVFRQLVRIKFAVWALNSCYHHLRERRTIAESLDRAGQWTQQSESQFHQTSVWLHEMNQVIRGLETYMAHQAVKACWSKFMKRLIGFNPDNVESLSLSSSSSQSAVIENLDQLISVHEAYVDDVLRDCLLDSSYSEIQQVICGLLSCVYWFYKVLSTGSWLSRTSLITGQLNSTGWAQLQAAHASFVQHTRFLRRRVGCMLSTSRTDPSTSLSQLVLALGINDFYNVRIGDLQSVQKNSFHRDNFADQLNTRRA
ncbi:Gamma-tubulin complex component, partial [Fasciola gigantica]